MQSRRFFCSLLICSRRDLETQTPLLSRSCYHRPAVAVRCLATLSVSLQLFRSRVTLVDSSRPQCNPQSAIISCCFFPRLRTFNSSYCSAVSAVGYQLTAMDEPQLPDDRSDSTAVAEDLSVRRLTGRRAIPNCARCRNHNVIAPIKGHKRYCPYTYCTCFKCRFTTDRQRIMARQVSTLYRSASTSDQIHSFQCRYKVLNSDHQFWTNDIYGNPLKLYKYMHNVSCQTC